MLKRADESDCEAMERFCSGSLLGAYLGCRLRCYGLRFDFVKFWLARSGETVTAVVGALEETAVLLASPQADHAELAAFLRMMPFRSVMTTAETADRCGIRNYIKKQSLIYRGGERAAPCAQAVDLKAVYALISQEIPGSFSREKEAYLAFLSDFTFRKNRSAARSAAIYEYQTLCACALTAAETQECAVLSGIAADARFSRQGYGKRVVLSLANELQAEGKTVYVIALNDSAAAFYLHIGFVPGQELAILERKPHV